MFHYIVEGGLTYLCMTDNTIGRRVPYMFLEDVKAKFRQAIGTRWIDAPAYAFDHEFKPVMRKLMVRYRHSDKREGAREGHHS